MKHTTIRVAICAAVLSALPVFAEGGYTCHWTGAKTHGDNHADWTDPGNWQEGVVPGLWTTKQGDGSVVTNGSLGCTAVFGKSATDLGRYIRAASDEASGLLSIKTLRFEGTDCSAYTFTYYKGWQWGSFDLCLESGGSIEVAAGVPTAPKFDGVKFVNPQESVPTILENNAPTAMEITKLTIPKCWI